MSIKYFYNFSLRGVDEFDLMSDILSGVRRSYFNGYTKIRDCITVNSSGNSFLFDFSLEKDKPMNWTVKAADGSVVQEVYTADNGKYYIYFYFRNALFKRLLFSRMHTLLKSEYFDPNTGQMRYSLEPRKAQNGLCLLLTMRTQPYPLVLYPQPDVADPAIRAKAEQEFTEYFAAAYTNDGVIRFMTEEQLAEFREFLDNSEEELKNLQEESFVGESAPLFEKINAKDFNTKRNLATSLDITRAAEFGVGYEEPESDPAEEYKSAAAVAETDTPAEPVLEEPLIEDEAADAEEAVAPVPEVQPEAQADVSPEPISEVVPETVLRADEADKLITVDDTVYRYYGELDDEGNRSGFGRTMTDQGKTAYEGHYLNDLRSGNGSYYYKDGSLCYSGEWRNNARHGVGVGVSSQDGSIHVGKWKDNRPVGNGVRLTSDGDIRFVCKELSDGCTVLTNYLPDDTVVISKYDPAGKKISEKTVSFSSLFE